MKTETKLSGTREHKITAPTKPQPKEGQKDPSKQVTPNNGGNAA